MLLGRQCIIWSVRNNQVETNYLIPLFDVNIDISDYRYFRYIDNSRSILKSKILEILKCSSKPLKTRILNKL